MNIGNFPGDFFSAIWYKALLFNEYAFHLKRLKWIVDSGFNQGADLGFSLWRGGGFSKKNFEIRQLFLGRPNWFLSSPKSL